MIDLKAEWDKMEIPSGHTLVWGMLSLRNDANLFVVIEEDDDHERSAVHVWDFLKKEFIIKNSLTSDISKSSSELRTFPDPTGEFLECLNMAQANFDVYSQENSTTPSDRFEARGLHG